MNTSSLWSLRLGFSNKQSSAIQKIGIEAFLNKSFSSKIDYLVPQLLEQEPKTIEELKTLRQKIKNLPQEKVEILIKQQAKTGIELRKWWLSKMQEEEFPLREKMTCFWHNHFVSTLQKVKVNYWVYQHNMILRENAFGNFKELTKKVIETNAMVKYLDNVDNKKGALNENLSRELLELFTIGIGNYSELDIKNGAKALAGLTIGNEKAAYRKRIEDNDEVIYFSQKGVFKANDLVDIIFKQEKTPYLITEKLLKWFIYDNPSKELIKYYGDYFRKVDFEIQPLLFKIFTEEFTKNNSGSKIKDPLTYSLQIIDQLNIHNFNQEMLVFFLKQQGMDLMNQPNVKGWGGGNNWLTSQIYLQRNNVTDLLCSGNNINRRVFKNLEDEPKISLEKIKVKVNWNQNSNNKAIIKELSDRLLFTVDENIQKDMENIIKYDFDTHSDNADQVVLRLFNYITKLPEFQLI